MHVITLASSKGGCGKSAICISLATHAAKLGMSAFILDTDPQASCIVWSELRQHETPGVDRVRPDQLGRALDTLRNGGCDVAFIDTQGTDSAGSSIAIKYASFVLVPCRPYLPDIAAVRATREAITNLGKLYAVTLNSVSQRVSSRVADAQAALDARISPVISTRVAIPDAFAAGLGVCEYEPDGTSDREFAELWDFVRGRVN